MVEVLVNGELWASVSCCEIQEFIVGAPGVPPLPCRAPLCRARERDPPNANRPSGGSSRRAVGTPWCSRLPTHRATTAHGIVSDCESPLRSGEPRLRTAGLHDSHEGA